MLRDDAAVVTLVTRASDGDKTAWDEIVERYAPLVWSICSRYRLDRVDANDVGQNVWLRLVEKLSTLREPAALPGWLATTTHRECLQAIRATEKQRKIERRVGSESDVVIPAVEQEILAAERNAAFRRALGQLSARCRRLLSMLLQDPPVPYAEISTTLSMPVGSIGPSRARCLEKLRRSPPLAAFFDQDAGHSGGGDRHGHSVVG